MPTLQDIRQQYPQYDDMSDQELTDALYKKFYSDMPRDDFNSKIGFNPNGINAGSFWQRTLGVLGASGGGPPPNTKEEVGDYAASHATAGSEIAKGVPIAGAYVPQTPQMTQFEGQYPGAAKTAQAVGGVLGAAPAFALGPGGALGAMGTAGALGGADTLARGGTAAEAGRDALISSLLSGAGSTIGKAIGGIGSTFTPKVTKTIYEIERPPSLTPSYDPLQGKSQTELQRAFEGGNPRIRAVEREVPGELSHEKVQAVGTALGAGLGHLFGVPEGAFIGYGISPGLTKVLPGAGAWAAKNLPSAAMSPATQSLLYSLMRRGEENPTYQGMFK